MQTTKTGSFEFDYEAVKNKALDQLRSGKPLLGKGGALAPLFKSFLEAALEAELSEHLGEADEGVANRRNGHGSKQLRTSEGTIELTTPRDRAGSFEPDIVKKRQTILADSMEPKIIGMYGLGMSLRDIAAHIKEVYDTDISATVLSEITAHYSGRKTLAKSATGQYLHHCMAGCHVLQSKRGRQLCNHPLYL
jgi:putative transposase